MKIVILTGAGVSAESGVPTFRDKGGLWKNFRAEDLATPQAFKRDPKLVWEWYNWRRGIISKAKPNKAHLIIAEMEEKFGVRLITQNVDGLHQKAGSKSVVELHGNIWRVKCTHCNYKDYDYSVPLKEIPPKCPKCGGLLRPDVVWFGEPLPEDAIEEAFYLSENCDIMIVVGTSGVVYPAANLPFIAKYRGARVIEINPKETPISSIADLKIGKTATEGMEEVYHWIERSFK
ncbi:MAG: NAD-dependent deacylase [candidate division WOR-3 bacterium]